VTAPTPMGDGVPKGPTPDDRMSEKEKKDLVDQVEEFEGPDRREKRGSEPPGEDNSGVARS
jgi:hypothetical protein